MLATLKVLMGVSRPILYYLLSTYSFVLFFIWQINTFLFCSVLFSKVTPSSNISNRGHQMFCTFQDMSRQGVETA